MRSVHLVRSTIVLVAVLVLGAAEAMAQDAAADFKANCATCHTIGGGRLTGPDLKNVTQRKDRAWLTKFIANPKSVIDSGDAYAAQILKESMGVPMPTLGLSPQRIDALLTLIEEESKLEKSQFAGMQISDRPFTPADIERGQRLFTGRERLAGGGSACISCHNVEGLSGLGGGTLGPDLTKVFERLGGRKGMSAWLSAPATPTMQAVFASHPMDSEDILALVAFFQDAAQKPEAGTSGLWFIILGLLGAATLLSLLNQLWKGRLRNVRKDMVEGSRI